MGAIEYDLTRLEQRFTRLRHVIDGKRAKLQDIDSQVRLCFRKGDVAAIAELSLERARLLDLVDKLELFVEKWEKEWQEFQHASNWIPSYKTL
jgi:hypothetical protein